MMPNGGKWEKPNMARSGMSIAPLALVAAALLFIHAAPASDPTTAPAPLPTTLPSGAPSAQPATPAILDVVFSPSPLKAGKAVSLTVRTTPDVMTVSGRVLAYTFDVPKTGDGEFSGHGSVPWFARFYHGTFSITFTGRDAAGNATQFIQAIRM